MCNREITRGRALLNITISIACFSVNHFSSPGTVLLRPCLLTKLAIGAVIFADGQVVSIIQVINLQTNVNDTYKYITATHSLKHHKLTTLLCFTSSHCYGKCHLRTGLFPSSRSMQTLSAGSGITHFRGVPVVKVPAVVVTTKPSCREPASNWQGRQCKALILAWVYLALSYFFTHGIVRDGVQPQSAPRATNSRAHVEGWLQLVLMLNALIAGDSFYSATSWR